MNLSNKNWKTTAAGIAAIMIAVGGCLAALTDADPKTTVDFTSIFAALTAGIGLIFARDGDKSSIQLGIKE